MCTNTENQEYDDSLMTISHSDTNAIFLALDALGVSRSQFARLKTDGDLCQQVATMLCSPGFAESISVTQAKKILGKTNVMGPAEIKKAFGVELSPEQIPVIPFSRQELAKAEKLKQFLVLRIDELAADTPATMLNLYNLCQPKFKEMKAGKVLYSDIGDGWYSKQGEEEEFFIKDTPKLKWYLISKEVIKDSLNKNYFQQTQVIADYLSDKIFADNTMPAEYQQAVAEFKSERDEIAKLMENNWQAAAKRLSELQINQIFRRSPVEAFYDFLIYFLNNKERLLENRYDWTFRLDAYGGLVIFGYCDSDGAHASHGSPPDDYGGRLGVCFSRSGNL
jgi:hypothetical protein